MAGQNAIEHLQPTSSPSFLLTFTSQRLLHHMKSCRAQLPLQNKDPPAQHTLSQTYPVNEYRPQSSSQILWEGASMHAAHICFLRHAGGAGSQNGSDQQGQGAAASATPQTPEEKQALYLKHKAQVGLA